MVDDQLPVVFLNLLQSFASGTVVVVRSMHACSSRSFEAMLPYGYNVSPLFILMISLTRLSLPFRVLLLYFTTTTIWP